MGDAEEHPLTVPRAAAIAVAALAAGAAVVAIELASDHRDARVVWAVFAPAVIWSFVGTGLYAWRARPESRVGLLMVLLGFAWVLFTLDAANAAWLYTIGLVTGGLWGGVFLHLGLGFPTGRLLTRLDRTLAIAGYIIFPLAFVPALLFAGPAELNCPDCPTNVLLIRPDEDLAAILTGVGALAYATLFVVVLRRALQRWRGTSAFERLQLGPVYVCALGTFLLVTVARAGGGDVAFWAAFVATALTPFAFLGGLLRSHVSHLDHELAETTEELRASRARLVEAGDAARRRLERDLHDGAQSRLVALALLLRTARRRVDRRRAAREPARPSAGGAGHEPRGAAGARSRHPPRGADRAGPGAGAAVARGAGAGARGRRGAQRAAPRSRRERRLLRRLRGARERREVRAGDARVGDGRAAQRGAHGRGGRRRRRRCGPRARVRVARAGGSPGGARRVAEPRQPRGPRYAPASADPLRGR